MEAKDLKAIIEQVLQEMNVSSDEKQPRKLQQHRHRQQSARMESVWRFRKKALNWSLLLLRTAAFRI